MNFSYMIKPHLLDINISNTQAFYKLCKDNITEKNRNPSNNTANTLLFCKVKGEQKSRNSLGIHNTEKLQG